MRQKKQIINRSVVVITDDVTVACLLSYQWAKLEKYFAVIEPPRTDRPDAENEVIRVLNVITRIAPKLVIYYGKDRRIYDNFKNLVKGPFLQFKNIDEFSRFNIGIDEWKSLDSEASVRKLHSIANSSFKNTCIIYAGDPTIGYAISANYAILHRSDLYRIKQTKALVRECVDILNKIDSEAPEVRMIDIKLLKEKLSVYLPDEVRTRKYKRILIVSDGIPYGIGLDEKKIIYASDLLLGVTLAHNVYEYEWGLHERVGPIGLFLADRSVESPKENEAFSEAFRNSRGLDKRFVTTHPKLAELEIMTLPYDVLYIATHAKQLTGSKQRFDINIDGTAHSLVADVAEGVNGKVFFIDSVDGVKKDAKEWTENLSEIWGKFSIKYLQPGNPPEPTEILIKEIELPMRTLVLGHEPGQNSPLAVQRLASNQRPIVIANACGSWTELSPRFIFAGASHYIGTLWAISSPSAAKFGATFLKNLFRKPLIDAFYIAKKSLPDEIDRMNYVAIGSFENKYDSKTPFSSDGLREVQKRISVALNQTINKIKTFNKDTPKDIRNNVEIDKMMLEGYRDELQQQIDELSQNT